MPYKYLIDSAGESLKCLDIDGVLLAPALIKDHEENFRTIKNWKCKQDDVIICAYPRSGTHWTWEIVSMLMNGKAEHISYKKDSCNIEFLSEGQMELLPSPRVLNSHLKLHQLPTDITDKKCKIVFVDRNPKDVAVSFYHLHLKIFPYEYKGKWENYVYRFLDGLIDFGSWFDYTLDWEKVVNESKDLPIHIVHYEDMKRNLMKEVVRLSQFLGIDQTEETSEVCKNISYMCEFEVMKAEKDPIEAAANYWSNGPGHYRKGIIGDWKNWFTVRQNEDFNAFYDEKMKNSKLTFQGLH